MEILIVAAPFIASIITSIFSRNISKNTAAFITCSSVLFSAFLSVVTFCSISQYGIVKHITIMSWLNLNGANWSIYIDNLTSIMLVTITIVSFAVHLYSVSYMHDDENMQRFMSYISLFTSCMIILVVSDNFAQLFFGWEGVGTCSYLLIGFWNKKNSANYAALKAFIVNRIGDFGFLIGILSFYSITGTMSFSGISEFIHLASSKYVTIFGENYSLIEFTSFMLFIGCMGKSAQIGLHVWLADAMEGPTPVSGLIHAATMVTAGIFLLARCSGIFEHAHFVLGFITIIGSITCIFGAIVATGQNDIKKIIAYSTCSQLGYMFIACGLSEYHFGIFHLFTHAFFKAMLFLGAGIVIHMLHEQDIEKMGGLINYVPRLYFYVFIGSIAIMGVFPFAGYYSKDLILTGAYLSGYQNGSITGVIGYNFGLLAAFFTGVYSTKILVKVFHGKPQFKATGKHFKIPGNMNIAMIILCAGSILSGLYGYYILHIGDNDGFLSKSIYISHKVHHLHPPLLVELAPMITSLAGAFFGMVYFWYDDKIKISRLVTLLVHPFYLFVRNKFYFDEVYHVVFVKTLDRAAQISNYFDKKIIDFLATDFASIGTIFTSQNVAYIHNGEISRYATSFILGVIVCLSIIIYYLAM
ncbi:MAG: NADH-quinone oxidoreductase subunit L [Rickettsiaceae bacterium]|nr:NADH-quinone oxidoreductase subunit L [Rickettsiaceae bacterium]